jgi:60 kDa SS-A/Ro ribonucleoprotein
MGFWIPGCLDSSGCLDSWLSGFPVSILIATSVYAQGHGDKGKLKWATTNQIVDALEGAFYKAFGSVTPAGKRTLLGLDVSGSMQSSRVSGSTLTAAQASAALAMVQAKTEPQYQLMAFDNGFRPLDISKCSRLTDVVHKTAIGNYGGTDCALPMLHAMQHKWGVGKFLVYTDNETWAGKIHPSQALKHYRQVMGIPARLIVVGMTSNGFTIADPDDAGMLDVVGWTRPLRM